jgi:hypothetical protein
MTLRMTEKERAIAAIVRIETKRDTQTVPALLCAVLDWVAAASEAAGVAQVGCGGIMRAPKDSGIYVSASPLVRDASV